MFPRLFCCALMVVAYTDCMAQPATPNSRQEQVRQKGAQVMPFALKQTVHVFDKTASGGVQRVLVRGDAPEQLVMIRSHLQDIAKAFAARDFSKPMHIHGTDMPGLADMQAAKPGDLSTEYKEVADGAQITYRSHSPKVVTAIHRWFDAQVSDHGDDAMTHDSGDHAKSP